MLKLLKIPPPSSLCVCALTILLSELLCFLVRDVPLGLQVRFVSYENDHLRIQRQQE